MRLKSEELGRVNSPAITKHWGLIKSSQEFYRGLFYWRLWISLAVNEINQRYRRTWVGISWIAISFGLFTGVKIFIFGALSESTNAYFAGYLTLGYLIFRFISNCITVGSSALISAASWIKSEPLPLTVYFYKVLSKNLIVFGFNIVPTIMICLYFGSIQFSHLWIIPITIIIYIINGIWVIALMAMLCARHRDILHFSATAVSITYFITPVLWVAPETGLRAKLAFYNPLTHYLDITRLSLLNGTIPVDSFIIVGVITLVGCLSALIGYSISRRKLIFWL